MQSREFLGTEPVGKLLLKLSIPTITAQMINLLYNLVDRIFIGHIPMTGALALTGVGVCLPIIMIVSAFAALVGTGGAPRASILLGKKKNEEAEEIVGQSFTTLLLIAAILTVVLVIFARPLLTVFGASENTIDYGAAYMRIYSMGTIFVMITLGMNMFLTTQGFTKNSMISVLLGAILNIILDPVFIFGLQMGVRGAALATILSQAVSSIYILCFLMSDKTVLRIKRKNLRIKSKVIIPCLALGSASFIMQATESILQMCFNSSLLKYGGDLAVGSMTILNSLLQFIVLPANGLSQGAQPILSYNYGAGNSERVKHTFGTMLKISLVFTIVFCSLMILFPTVPVALFTTDKKLVAYASKCLRIYIAGMTIFGIQMAVQCAFTALGKAKQAILVASMRKLIFLIPFIYIFPVIMPVIFGMDKVTAVFLAEPVADVLSVLFATFLFLKTFSGLEFTEER